MPLLPLVITVGMLHEICARMANMEWKEAERDQEASAERLEMERKAAAKRLKME